MNPTTSIGLAINEGSTIRDIIECTVTSDGVEDERKAFQFVCIKALAKVIHNRF
jgi:riboflavin synthase